MNKLFNFADLVRLSQSTNYPPEVEAAVDRRIVSFLLHRNDVPAALVVERLASPNHSAGLVAKRIDALIKRGDLASEFRMQRTFVRLKPDQHLTQMTNVYIQKASSHMLTSSEIGSISNKNGDFPMRAHPSEIAMSTSRPEGLPDDRELELEELAALERSRAVPVKVNAPTSTADSPDNVVGAAEVERIKYYAGMMRAYVEWSAEDMVSVTGLRRSTIGQYMRRGFSAGVILRRANPADGRQMLYRLSTTTVPDEVVVKVEGAGPIEDVPTAPALFEEIYRIKGAVVSKKELEATLGFIERSGLLDGSKNLASIGIKITVGTATLDSTEMIALYNLAHRSV